RRRARLPPAAWPTAPPPTTRAPRAPSCRPLAASRSSSSSTSCWARCPPCLPRATRASLSASRIGRPPSTGAPACTPDDIPLCPIHQLARGPARLSSPFSLLFLLSSPLLSSPLLSSLLLSSPARS